MPCRRDSTKVRRLGARRMESSGGDRDQTTREPSVIDK